MSIFDNNVNLLFGKYGTKTIGGIEIDAMVEERHTQTAAVTQYPVEEGFTINDHVTQNPDGLTLHCAVGPQPVKTFGGIGNLTSLDNNAYAVYSGLADYKQAGEIIDVVTGLRVYENMIIDNLSITRNRDNGKGLDFDIGFVQLTIVKSLETTIPASSQKRKIANSKANKGTGTGYTYDKTRVGLLGG